MPNQHLRIEVKALCKPNFFIMVRNTFDDNIVFDDDGIPQRQEENHGFGTKTMVALCQKVGGFCDFQADGKVFSVYMHLK
ncbi:MAG: GHKL domain-containing protein [Oscillospiraceae bacterium]|nr:GHKL domain-containing protein [Oscillospiraceae bacterium]